MDPARLLQLVAEGESQTLEFKQSLSSGAQREAIESLVAFVNTEGGRVLLGVQDDGTVRGVQIGTDTLERLANRIRQHTYPSLPATLEIAKDGSGKNIVVVEAPRDRPPVIGVYMYSEKPIRPDEPVDASRMQAYRRVGRTNQKEDLMRLRGSMPSDPKVRLTIRSAFEFDQEDGRRLTLVGSVWVEEGSGSAHLISFACDPVIGQCEESIDDLPYPHRTSIETPGARFNISRTVREMINQAEFSFSCEDLTDRLPFDFRFSATYMDDSGLAWRSSREASFFLNTGVERSFIDVLDRGDFRRQIVRFPPKERPHR